MTNFERITQSPEELAKFLSGSTECEFCPLEEFCTTLDHWHGCKETIVEWLGKNENNE